MSKADVDRFALRAKTLRERLQQNQVVTGEAASILVEFEDQLASLCRATEPIRTRTQALTRAQLNIERIQAHAEELLEHLDVSRKVERRIREGPGADLDGYLELTRQLSKAIRFLQGCEHLKSTKSALRHATELRAAALSHCEQRFREALSRSTVRAEFPALAQQALASMESLREDLRSGASSKTSQAPREEGLTLVRPEAIGTLRKIAAVALEADNQNQSLQILKVFADSRRRALHGIVQHSGVDMGSRDEVHRMAWDALEKKIQGWIVLSHVLARVVACERRLAGTVFRPPYDDMTFSEVVYPTVEDFVLYGHSITSVKRTPE
uniref:Exocyst subunit exo70 family protein n=2 Tax=Tetraselmis sp. GSL018 TaxID=582737 RepID=A0A061RPB9_9CHLO|eukprot:CAMPEP_0177627294 /NCGR_PEP_ID=MMETSP0419_2-20121207/31124_1 /TAXON_ID=582737 /ORGANISM="Tetraselmis sp., Strain GSL018" /LENGTH=324 /DNA_ID=CAMNT_0019128433 /DNA_START=187 /DNA_END=1161 /DNA_ORIENTATION=-